MPSVPRRQGEWRQEERLSPSAASNSPAPGFPRVRRPEAFQARSSREEVKPPPGKQAAGLFAAHQQGEVPREARDASPARRR